MKLTTLCLALLCAGCDYPNLSPWSGESRLQNIQDGRRQWEEREHREATLRLERERLELERQRLKLERERGW